MQLELLAAIGRSLGARSLNGQPTPPAEAGVLAAREIVRLAWIAEQLGLDVRPDPDHVPDRLLWPFGPKHPPIPWPPTPVGLLEGRLEYHLALAGTLAVTVAEWEGAVPAIITTALDLSVGDLESARTHLAEAEPAGSELAAIT